jgi:HEAT repeat protein
VSKVRLARGIANVLLVAGLVAAVTWQVASRGPEVITYWRNLARVSRAERALERGDRWSALQLLGQAGEPGEERLGQLLVACHSRDHWPGLVADLRRSSQTVHEAVAGAMARSPEESLCAAEALAAVGNKRGVLLLAWALRSRPESAHDPSELLSLGAAGCEALANVARSGSAQAREEALALLSDPQVPETKGTLIGLLSDPRFPHKSEVLRALGPHGGRALEAAVERFAIDPDPSTRAEAIRQCAARKGIRALPVLSAALEDADGGVRLAAVEALCEVQGRQADRLLVRALRDGDRRVVRRAIRALGRRKALDAGPALAEAYARGPRELRQEIASALCWMDSPLAAQQQRLWEQETGKKLVVSSAWDG